MKILLYYFYIPLFYFALYASFKYTSIYTIASCILTYILCLIKLRKEIIDKEREKEESLKKLFKNVVYFSDLKKDK